MSAILVFSGVALVLHGCGGGSATHISIPRRAHDLGNYVSSESGPATGTGDDAGVSDNPDFSTGSGCGSVTSSGACSGTVLVYCDTSSGQVVSMDCAAQGDVCTVDSFGSPSCTSGSTGGGGGSCGNIDSSGICNGDILEYCAGTLTTQDCSMLGQTCMVDSSGYANCY
ncbi:MAG: hypothetical protein ABI321_03320 [Polyangia bacterium]